MRSEIFVILRSIVLAGGLWVAQASAVTILIDYRYDTQTEGFFTANPQAKASLDAAAADLSSAIHASLGTITSSQSRITGTNGSSALNFDWHHIITNPSTGAQVTITDTSIAANTVVIYAGMQELGGNLLGQGAIADISFSLSGGAYESELEGAVNSAATQSTAVYSRGGGPVAYTLEGDISLGSVIAPYAITTGISVGNLWFDRDTDNDDFADDLAELDAYWHFNHLTAVSAGKFDFYSVAMHEMLHTLGFGTSESWNHLVFGNDWAGANTISLMGSGANLIDSSGSHLATGIMSTRISDGGAQSPVMASTLQKGERLHLTQLDRAMMMDIGWNGSAVPEPSSLVLALAGLVLLIRRRR